MLQLLMIGEFLKDKNSMNLLFKPLIK